MHTYLITQSWLLKVVLRKQCMSCRIFVEMQKTIFILNFGPDFFARHLDNFTSKSFFFCYWYQQYNFGVSRLREKELTKEKMSYVSSELLPLSHANILTCISWRSWAQMIGFHLKVRYYTRERSFIQMNTHIFQGSLNHISIVLILYTVCPGWKRWISFLNYGEAKHI